MIIHFQCLDGLCLTPFFIDRKRKDRPWLGKEINGLTEEWGSAEDMRGGDYQWMDGGCYRLYPCSRPGC